MTVGRLSLQPTLTVVLLFIGVLLACPGRVNAYATPGAAPNASSISGLPDGRVYELVSPFNKHGYPAGAVLQAGQAKVLYSIASPDGNAVAFESQGPAADLNSSGLDQVFVANRGVGGWTSRAATPRGLALNETIGVYVQIPKWLDFSSDLSKLVFGVPGPDTEGAPSESSANLYMEGSDPLQEPVWLARPTIGTPELGGNLSVAGSAPDLSTVYFAFEGTLLPSDAGRSGWGFYEFAQGSPSYAGVLPDGSISPLGAVPIAIASSHVTGLDSGGALYSPGSSDNQVSSDGKRAFFVSPDPGLSSVSQLYVREVLSDGTRRTVLVSRSQVPGQVGQPAIHGTTYFPNPEREASKAHNDFAYGYASPDGSHVIFASVDRLTTDAPENSTVKMYDFNVDTETTAYLSEVTGGIVASTKSGSSLLFENTSTSPFELDLWQSNASGARVTPIAQLNENGLSPCDGTVCVGPARMSDGGEVVIFTTEAPIAGFNNIGPGYPPEEFAVRGPGFQQIYRYVTSTNELTCISCPPSGVTPSGDAYFSSVDEYGNDKKDSFAKGYVGPDHGVTADGNRILFATPDPLVPQDTNGKLDVYEWEDGTVFLLSQGTSANDSVFLDSSESGGDAFFTTTDERVTGDNDGNYDVYDARVPRPGDTLAPSAVPCEGEVCQGPPSVPSLLGEPASATFDGLSNGAHSGARPVAKHVKHVKKKKIRHKKRKKQKKTKRAVGNRRAK